MRQQTATEWDQVEILTAQDLARYLRLAEATIYKLAQAGEIPAVKIGRAWRFKKQLIDEWFRERASNQGGAGQDTEATAQDKPED